MDCQWAFFVHKNSIVFDTNPNVKPCPRNRLDNVLLIAPGLTLGFVHNKKGPRTMTDHTIKAIETQFKGYRFRSRLEARWAVFFDALGIQWEYEKEGYDLGELGWYLPDFWLPEFNQWVEVKPPTTETAKSVYLAGSFKNDWRFQFVGSEYQKQDMDDGSQFLNHTRFGRSYTGPFRVDLEQGHGRTEDGHIAQHFGGPDPRVTSREDLVDFLKHNTGMEDDGWEAQDVDEYIKEWNEWNKGGMENERKVYQRCLSQIDSADIVFTWIDNLYCYGTLAEIGYAKAKGKTIWMGIDESINSGNLWFVQEMADVLMFGKNAIDVYSKIDPMSDEQKKVNALIRGLDRNGARGKYIHGVIVYGDPMNRTADHFDFRDLVRFGDLWLTRVGFLSIPTGYHYKEHTDFSQAAQKARSARF